MVYKEIKFRVRPTKDILADLEEARRVYGQGVETIFFPAGNTIAMPTPALAEICRHSYQLFPRLQRLTVYGSSQFIYRKGLEKLRTLKEAGLTRIHVGVESGDDAILARVKKGATSAQQIEAGRMLREAGIENSAYVILGLGGQERSWEHARETARVINASPPDFLRLRTLVPKVNTPLLVEVLAGQLQMLSPHGVLRETLALIEGITVPTQVVSDHYTNYLNVSGRLPEEKEAMLGNLKRALAREEGTFRPFFIGTE
jgi:radical SAM superfamily enzyme YgiQ (UPF0313 family)